MNQVTRSHWTNCNANVFMSMAAQCLAVKVGFLSPTSVPDTCSAYIAGPPWMHRHQWLGRCSSLTVTSRSLHSFGDSKLRRPYNELQCTDAYTCSMRRWPRNVDASALPALKHEECTLGPGSNRTRTRQHTDTSEAPPIAATPHSGSPKILVLWEAISIPDKPASWKSYFDSVGSSQCSINTFKMGSAREYPCGPHCAMTGTSKQFTTSQRQAGNSCDANVSMAWALPNRSVRTTCRLKTTTLGGGCADRAALFLKTSFAKLEPCLTMYQHVVRDPKCRQLCAQMRTQMQQPITRPSGSCIAKHMQPAGARVTDALGRVLVHRPRMAWSTPGIGSMVSITDRSVHNPDRTNPIAECLRYLIVPNCPSRKRDADARWRAASWWVFCFLVDLDAVMLVSMLSVVAASKYAVPWQPSILG